MASKFSATFSGDESVTMSAAIVETGTVKTTSSVTSGMSASAATGGDDRSQVETGLSPTKESMQVEVESLVFGTAATIEVGKVESGDEASVVNVGTPNKAVLDFVLPRGPAGTPGSFEIGHGLQLDAETNTLSVKTATAVEADNTLPVTSAAVSVTVGNIEALLETI